MLNIYEKCPQPRFFTCGCLENDGGFLHIRRTLNCDVLIFVTEGTLFITMNDTDLAVCPGEYVLLPSRHRTLGHKAMRRQAFHICGYTSLLRKPVGESCPESGFAYIIPEHFTAADPRRVSIIFRQLLDYQRQERLYTEMLPVCTLSMLLMEITQQYLAAGNEHEISPKIYNICQWIRSNCQKKLTAEMIARHFHYNAEYLSLIFKRETRLYAYKISKPH